MPRNLFSGIFFCAAALNIHCYNFPAIFMKKLCGFQEETMNNDIQ
jgi:hypothetical protein